MMLQTMISIAQGGIHRLQLMLLTGLLVLVFTPAVTADADTQADLRKDFEKAWAAAREGRRDEFERLGPGLQNYILYPYWQYEDYRHRRAQVAPATMDAFLQAHADWAFTPGLRTAWLRTLGKNRRWSDLLSYGEGSTNTEVRCFVAQARLRNGDLDGLMTEARELWTVGNSQPDACDPLFDWFAAQGGITGELAWERIRLAMAEGNPRLTLFLARYVPAPQREWLDRWQRFDMDRYRQLNRARSWHDSELTRMIAAESLRSLARIDPASAMQLFGPLSRHFAWSDATRGDLMREVALWAAVDLDVDALAFIPEVPPAYRNDQLLEWWARLAMSTGDWMTVAEAISGMSEEAASDDRWRYWKARSALNTGQLTAGNALLEALATSTNYYGFLAADALDAPYTICPAEPPVTEVQIEALMNSPRFQRALELHQVDLDNWARAEWARAAAALPAEQLKVAAGLARREGWYDRVIFALGDSGELSFYEWRFPVIFTDLIMEAAGDYDLDAAYLLGIMRSESAMMETARSPAGALGLMQVMPATARTLSRKHGLPYQASSELLQGPNNIDFGAVYLRDLLNDYDQNPVLVSGAYNAGPNAVARWLGTRKLDEAAQWIETLPYYETRDYIPRVLTFTTLYDWRLQKPVRRISSRMPGIESGTIANDSTVEIVCRAFPGEAPRTGP